MTKIKNDARQPAAPEIDPAEMPDDENPEWTADAIAEAKPFAEMFPQMAETIRRGRGPGKKPAKVMTTIRFDPDVVDALKGDDPAGWQARANDLLRKALKLPKAS